MSSPVEIVKKMYAAFSRGDIAGVMAHVADDAEWNFEGPAEMSFAGMRRGKQQILEGFFGGIAREHADPRLEVTEFVSEGDRVATFGRYAATLKPGGQRVDSPVAHLFKFRDGKVVHYTNMLNTAAFVGGPPTSGIAVSFNPAKMTAAQYDAIMQRLAEAGAIPPEGARFHVCYGEGDQLRVMDIYDSLESFQKFSATLMPIIKSAGVDPGQPEVRPVHGPKVQFRGNRG